MELQIHYLTSSIRPDAEKYPEMAAALGVVVGVGGEGYVEVFTPVFKISVELVLWWHDKMHQ